MNYKKPYDFLTPSPPTFLKLNKATKVQRWPICIF